MRLNTGGLRERILKKRREFVNPGRDCTSFLLSGFGPVKLDYGVCGSETIARRKYSPSWVLPISTVVLVEGSLI